MRISDWSSDVCSSDLSPTSVLRSRVSYRRSCAIIVILLENPIALGGSKGSVGFVEVDDHRRPVARGAELRGVALDRVLLHRCPPPGLLAPAVQDGGQPRCPRPRSPPAHTGTGAAAPTA